VSCWLGMIILNMIISVRKSNVHMVIMVNDIDMLRDFFVQGLYCVKGCLCKWS
jgi:hypothetical protein